MLMAAVALPVLVAFMGLAVDVGFLYHLKRRMQHAADAGAMGGAHELYRMSPDRVTAAALIDSKTNGFDNDKPDILVTVNNPPTSGPNAGNNNFVEVIIDQQAPTFFLHVVDRQSADVRARAVAGLVAASDFCVVALNPVEKGALTVEGTAALNAQCGVMVNSTDERALLVNGGGCIYSEEVGVSGAYVLNGSANCVLPYAPLTDVPPVLDPLAYLAAPVPLLPVPIATGLKIPSGATVVLAPGVYDMGIEITGANVTFLPGTYFLDGGGLKVTGDAVITGEGVTFYNTNSGDISRWGDIDIAGSVKATLRAPATGDCAGMLFWNDPAAPSRNPGSVIAGTSDSVFDGALYFPSTNLKYVGTSTASAWSMIIADTITVAGNAQVEADYDASSTRPPMRKVTLVE